MRDRHHLTQYLPVTHGSLDRPTGKATWHLNVRRVSKAVCELWTYDKGHRFERTMNSKFIFENSIYFYVKGVSSTTRCVAAVTVTLIIALVQQELTDLNKTTWLYDTLHLFRAQRKCVLGNQVRFNLEKYSRIGHTSSHQIQNYGYFVWIPFPGFNQDLRNGRLLLWCCVCLVFDMAVRLYCIL